MKKWWFRSYLLLVIIESGIFFSIQLDRSRVLNSYKLVFSTFNAISLVLLIVFLIGALVLLIVDLLGPNLRKRVDHLLKIEPIFWGILILSSVLFIESGQNLLFLRADLPEDYFPFFLLENIVIFQWGVIFSLQTIGLLILFRLQSISIAPVNTNGKRWIIGSGFVVLVLLILSFAGTGFMPRSVSKDLKLGTFEPTTAPITMIQVIVIMLGLTLVFWLINRAAFEKRTILKNSLTMITIWVIAMVVWSSVPITPNYFIDEIREPTNQYHPISDSIYYESQALRLVNGEGFFEKIQHPFYAYFLGGLHLIGGDHYLDIYLLQIAFLALIPVLIFKLSSLMISPYAGLLSAGFLIARDYNGLVLGDSITIATVQLLMTESMTQLLVILFVYLMVVWLSKSDPSVKGMPLLLGSVIGLLSLIRVEMLSLVGVFIIISGIRYWKDWKKWIWRSASLLSVVVLMTVPWMFRNKQEMGVFSLDKGEFFNREIKSLLSPATRDPIISDGEPAPDQVGVNRIEKITMHFRSSISESLLYLPSNHQPLTGIDNYLATNLDKGKISFEQGGIFSEKYLTGYIKTLNYWNMNWDGTISPWTILPLGIVLLSIMAGFFLVWERNKLIAITPLLVMILHFLTYSIFSRSGGRFIQVVDWISLIYFSFGLVTAGSWLSKRFGIKNIGDRMLTSGAAATEKAKSRIVDPGPTWKIYLSAGALILAGLSMPVVEAVIPPRYTEDSLGSRLESIDQDLVFKTAGTEADLLSSELIYGKALYPAYYQAGEGKLDDRAGHVPDSTPSRVEFYLVGMENIWVSIPLDLSPDTFPHGSDVIIQGEIIRNSQDFLNLGLRPYLLADQILVVDKNSDKILAMLTASETIDPYPDGK